MRRRASSPGRSKGPDRVTEEAAATPGWVEARLDGAFAGLPALPGVDEARRAYAECLASRKAPSAPSDLLGAEFESCRSALQRGLQSAGVERDSCGRVLAALEAIEAEIAAGS